MQPLQLLVFVSLSHLSQTNVHFIEGLLPKKQTIDHNDPTGWTNVERLVYDLGTGPPYNILVPLPARQYAFPDALFNPFNITLSKVRPVIDLVLHDLVRVKKLLRENSLVVRYVDTEQSAMWGPVRVIEAFWAHRAVDCVIGYATVYGLAPMARYSLAWPPNRGIPVMTTIGLTASMTDKQQYPLLTRVSPPYDGIGRMLEQFLVEFQYRLDGELPWKQVSRIAMVIDSVSRTMSVKATVPTSECEFKMQAFKIAVERSRKFQFPDNVQHLILWHSEHHRKRTGRSNYYHEILKQASYLGNC